MKQSEMIQDIQDYLDLINVTSPDFSNEQIAEYILLGCCETRGMMPPIDSIDDTGYSNGWEEEDET